MGSLDCRQHLRPSNVASRSPESSPVGSGGETQELSTISGLLVPSHAGGSPGRVEKPGWERRD